MTDTSWQNRVTLLVNSCDAYADLWQPFFTLLKRYFVPLPAEILLNTETKDFAFDGLNLRCVHSTAPTYGERMTDALREVKTEYTLLLLDDFFLSPAFVLYPFTLHPVRQHALKPGIELCRTFPPQTGSAATPQRMGRTGAATARLLQAQPFAAQLVTVGKRRQQPLRFARIAEYAETPASVPGQSLSQGHRHRAQIPLLVGHQPPGERGLVCPSLASGQRSRQLPKNPDFAQSGTKLAQCFVPDDTGNPCRQPGLFLVADPRLEITQDTGTQVGGLADMQHGAVCRHQAEYARHVGQMIDQTGTNAFGQLDGSQQVCRRGPDRILSQFGNGGLQEHVHRLGISQRPVAHAGRHVDAVTGNQAVEAVLGMLRIEPARQLDGAERIGSEGQTQPAKLVFQKAVVKAGVVRDQQFAVQARQQCRCQFGKRWSLCHHGIADAGHFFNERRNRLTGVNELRPASRDPVADFNQADFGNPVTGDVTSGRFQVDNDVRAIKHGNTLRG